MGLESINSCQVQIQVRGNRKNVEFPLAYTNPHVSAELTSYKWFPKKLYIHGLIARQLFNDFLEVSKILCS
jgi:hypothetical protein